MRNDNENNADVNTAGVCGVIAASSGYSQLSEFCAVLDIPVMSEKTYLSYQNNVMNNANDLATKDIINAGKEEYQLTVEARGVKNGTLEIAVIVDGAWSKRSYRSNYNVLSGVGCIVGVRIKKVLYKGVKNRFC
ncbi:hypothetical protein BDFB_007204 [Asbolus verrucosus]|uniref:Mutator-like transposase domain-containing protein n=1 Tax=Asbolus verrucosus TaxID=1661398 RepID=A0A482VMQ5_ASBVE|nr:hypothetical protein BDFB_007204 [Asbolus verrucosus]